MLKSAVSYALLFNVSRSKSLPPRRLRRRSELFTGTPLDFNAPGRKFVPSGGRQIWLSNKRRMNQGQVKCLITWLRGKDLTLRPPVYEPGELPDSSTPPANSTDRVTGGSTRSWKSGFEPDCGRG